MKAKRDKGIPWTERVRSVEERWRGSVLPQQPSQPKLKLPAQGLLVQPFEGFPATEGSTFRQLLLADVQLRFFQIQGQNCYLPVILDNLSVAFTREASKKRLPLKVYFEQCEREIRKCLSALAISSDTPQPLPLGTRRLIEAEQKLFLDLRRHRALFRRERLLTSTCEGCGHSLALASPSQPRCHHCGWQLTWVKSGPWLLKLSKFAEEALRDLREVNWPESVKREHRRLIGRESGLSVVIKIGSKFLDRYEEVHVFVPRAEYFLATTFLYVRYDHPALSELVDSFYREDLKAFRSRVEATSVHERVKLNREAPLTGIFAINPVTLQAIPVVAAADIPMDLDGRIGVPGYNAADRVVAELHKFPVSTPFGEAEPEEGPGLEAVCTLKGRYKDQPVRVVRDLITEDLIKRGVARKEVYTALRETVCSWTADSGVPVPVVSCPNCGEVPVKPPASGNEHELEENEVWFPGATHFRICPRCSKPTGAEVHKISWRSPLLSPALELSTRPREEEGELSFICLLDKSKRAYPFLISTVLVRFLRKRYDFISENPFLDLILVGSFSGSVEDLLQKVETWGTDAVRLALLGSAGPEKDLKLREEALKGMGRFLGKVRCLCNMVSKAKAQSAQELKADSEGLPLECERMVFFVTQALEKGKPHLAISTLINFVRFLNSPEGQIHHSNLKVFRTLSVCLSPFAPYHAAELFASTLSEEEARERSVFQEPWPPVPQKAPLPHEVEIAVFVEGKLCDKFTCLAGSRKQDLGRLALTRPKVQRLLAGRRVKYIFAVEDYLVNLVPKPEKEG